MGETCGMKLVNNAEYMPSQCKICEKIETKHRRIAAENERIVRWQNEGGVKKASIEKSQDIITELQDEIRHLEHERHMKQINIGNRTR